MQLNQLKPIKDALLWRYQYFGNNLHHNNEFFNFFSYTITVFSVHGTFN